MPSIRAILRRWAHATIPATWWQGHIFVAESSCPAPSVAPTVDKHEERAFCRHYPHTCANLQGAYSTTGQILCKAAKPKTVVGPKL